MDNLLEQIGKQSRKVFFQYNLLTNEFELLTPAVQQIWHIEPQQIKNNPEALLDTLADVDKEAFSRTMQKLLSGDAVEETVQIKVDDEFKFISYEAYPLRNGDGQIATVAGIAEDITHERQFLGYLSEFAQRKDSVLEIVSHDLRGPLAVVKNVAGLLRTEVDSDKQKEVEDYTRIIINACNTCTSLISDLLSEEHLRSPLVHVNKTRVDLTQQIRNVTESYQKAKVVSQSIELDFKEEPLMMDLDQIKFSQIMNNLISNSIKFTPADGCIQISARREGDNILIKHRDSGIGIPEKLQQALFDKYTKAGRVGLRGEESRGLGLYIVQDLVKLHGGSIRCESKENEGTAFHIRLPVYG